MTADRTSFDAVLPCATVKGLLVFGVWVLPLFVAQWAGAAEALHDGNGGPRVVVLEDGKNALAGNVLVLVDDTGTLTFDEVRGRPVDQFRPLARTGENAGYSGAAYWLWFRVKNATGAPSFVLELDMTAIAELHDDAGLARRSAASHPFGEREVPQGNIAFRITLRPGEEKAFWLQQRSNDTVVLDPVMWPERRFWESRSREQLLNGLCYGALIGLVMYNLFLFLGTRDRSYLLYVVFQVTNGLIQAALDRYTFQYLWPDHPAWAARSEQVLGCLALGAALAFAREFLATRRLAPRLDSPMRVLAIASLGFAVLGALSEHSGLKTLMGAHVLGSTMLIAVAATLVAARTGSTNARVFVVAWAVLLAGTVMAILQTEAILLSFNGFRLMKLGSAIEAVLLSLALASRINGLTRDRERAQREVLAAKTARIEALRRLVSGVAHEVGNPLNFARGGCEELEAQLDAIDHRAPGAERAARRAHKLVASGLTRIKLILDNLRRYLSVGDAEAVPSDLVHEIEQALELTSERLISAGVRVETQIDRLPALPARPGELHQVMLNLIGNAIEAMPGGGRLCVAAHAGDHAVEVSLTDTGPGVAAADREKVFEPFFTTRAETGGTGLGLAVAREIVMKHGGTIRVDDGDGGGARFVVSLPRVQTGAR